jgi:hypothetical protein
VALNVAALHGQIFCCPVSLMDGRLINTSSHDPSGRAHNYHHYCICGLRAHAWVPYLLIGPVLNTSAGTSVQPAGRSIYSCTKTRVNSVRLLLSSHAIAIIISSHAKLVTDALHVACGHPTRLVRIIWGTSHQIIPSSISSSL